MNLLHQYLEAATQSKRKFVALAIEAARLRVSKTRLGFSEYIDFRLYHSDLAFSEKASFAGQRAQADIEDLLIDDYSRFLSLDKVTMYAIFAGLRFPIPELKAVYRSMRPLVVRQLQTPDELAAFLCEPDNLPAYIKRSFGSYGRGNVLITAVQGHQVIFGNGHQELLTDFCASLDGARSLGWLIQHPLVAHPAIDSLTASSKISGLRVHTFLASDRVYVTKAVFKINTGTRDSDNFEHGASGNMLAAIDIHSGKVMRAIAGVGLQQIEISHHPKTGLPIVGFQIPHWAAVVQLVTEAQKAFPGFICPGWDIALCPDGPKILEVNAFGDVDLSQHAYRASFLDANFKACLKNRGLDQLLFAPARHHSRSPTNSRMGIKKHHWLW